MNGFVKVLLLILRIVNEKVPKNVVKITRKMTGQSHLVCVFGFNPVYIEDKTI